MKKSAFISDVIFAFFTAFLFCLCLFRYYKLGLFVAFLLSVLCGTLTACAIFAILQSKRKKIFLRKSDEELKEKLLLHLALSSEDALTKFFLQFFSQTQAVRPIKRLCLDGEEERYFLHFHIAPVSPDQILQMAKSQTDKRKVLLCASIDEAALRLASRFDITVKTGSDTFWLLKEQNALPQRFLGEENPIKKGKRRAKLWFSKSNSRRFLTGGAILLTTSLLTPFPYYYLVFGSLLLLAAALVRIFGYN